MGKAQTGTLDELVIGSMSAMMADASLGAVDLVDYYLERIECIDRAFGDAEGAGLNAVLHLNDKAREIAETLDKERKHGCLRGPLHGIPLLVKGNIDTGDTMPTTAGSLALKGHRARKDAALVAKLREAGAVILGKTNLSEWANFRAEISSSGWSSEGGQTRNPYALDRNPSGSSSGSAVAVSSNLCAAAIGTETDGSIISPSSVNGIVGIKPTVGLVSLDGIIPLCASQDSAGPMARTVLDAAIILSVMAGHDQGREIMSAIEPMPRSLSGIRLGVARNFCGFNAAVDRIFEQSLQALRDLGAEFVEMNLPSEKGFDEAEREVMLYEFRNGIEKYLGDSAHSLRTLDELIEFNRSHADTVMPWFGQDIFEAAAKKGSTHEEAYIKARILCIAASRDRGIDAALSMHRLDGILAPSGGPAWKIDHVHYSGGACTSMPAAAGYPHLTVPAGFIHGLPVGLSLFGTAFSEPTLLYIALAFEHYTRIRKPPEFRATAD